MVEAGPKKGLPQLSSGPQPQQRRSQERRRQLAKVALRLIEERGFEALSVNEIAEEAGISIGGMYRYIRTKTDLLVMACDDIFGGLREQMLEAVSAEQGLENKLSAAMRVYWLACHDRQDLLRLTYREYRSLPPEAKKLYKRQELEIADVFRDLIRAGIITDEFRAADDGVVAHEIIFLSHMNAFKNWALHGVDLDRLLTEHVELFVSRLRREAAIGPDRRR
jgi:AcrR family transcriptional regulator